MGLDISYQFSLPAATVDQAREVVLVLRTLALELSLAQVDDFVELQGQACKFEMQVILNMEDKLIFCAVILPLFNCSTKLKNWELTVKLKTKAITGKPEASQL